MSTVIRENLTFFCYELWPSDPNGRQSHGKIGFKDLAQTVSRNWKRIFPSERAHYYKLQEEAKLQYEHDMRNYEERMREWKASRPSQGPIPVENNPVSVSSVTMGSSALMEPVVQFGQFLHPNLHSAFAGNLGSNSHITAMIDQAFQSAALDAEDFQPLAVFRDELENTINQDYSVETFSQLW
eukprot:scaffold1752_cov188-Amphora_coffeaeformis.AAC.3